MQNKGDKLNSGKDFGGSNSLKFTVPSESAAVDKLNAEPAQISIFDEGVSGNEQNQQQESLQETSYVGFSTGDAELDRLINGTSEGYLQNESGTEIVEMSVGGAKISGFNKNKTVSGDKTAQNKTAQTAVVADIKSDEPEDYSYYGTIKPLAENAGINASKKTDNEREKAENAKNAQLTISPNEKPQSSPLETKNAENAEKSFSLQQEKDIKNALILAKPQADLHVAEINGIVTRVYDEVFKNNPAFKNSLESIIKNLEEYVQASLLSAMLQSETSYEWFSEFVYEILPDGDIFGGAVNELSVKIKIADALKKQPTAMLMFAAVDVSFGKSETKQLLNEIYGLYRTCVCALNIKPLAKEEILFNLISFAKNQGVNI